MGARIPAVEQQIRRALAEGKFDGLPGKSKRLDFDRNPFADPQWWRMAFHVMKLAGAVPDWVEMGNGIEAELDAIRTEIDAYARQIQRRRQEILDNPDGDLRAWMRTRYRWRRERRARLRARLPRLRRETERSNLIAPDTVAKVAVQVTPRLRDFDRCWPWPAPE